ncbi:hypothetical protein [Dongia sp.]|uniref:hypothetical protein n=1 Tax=Dongia sp. TaxID=1977262 RepID=UPI0035B2FA79
MTRFILRLHRPKGRFPEIGCKPTPCGMRQNGAGLTKQHAHYHIHWMYSDSFPPEHDIADVKIRDCLRCHKSFESTWAGERICRHCKGTSGWRNAHAGQVVGRSESSSRGFGTRMSRS